MTLGDIIREYLETNTMTDFSRESGISRAYAYMLIKNKNNSGGKIVPSWETIQQVAKGVHLPVDDVVAKLDKDYIVTVQAKGKPSDITDEEMQIIKAYRRASERDQVFVQYLLGLMPTDKPFDVL